MAAPRFVRTSSLGRTPSYASPDVIPNQWHAERPGEVATGQPSGGPLGFQGPDQGYALKLIDLFEGHIVLTAADRSTGIELADVNAGCVQVALKRASLFGRAPVVYDLEMAYRCWGWLDEAAPAELVTLRGKYFRGVADPHHYTQLRELVALVLPETLLQTPTQAAQQYDSDWRQLFSQQTFNQQVPSP